MDQVHVAENTKKDEGGGEHHGVCRPLWMRGERIEHVGDQDRSQHNNQILVEEGNGITVKNLSKFTGAPFQQPEFSKTLPKSEEKRQESSQEEKPWGKEGNLDDADTCKNAQ